MKINSQRVISKRKIHRENQDFTSHYLPLARNNNKLRSIFLWQTNEMERIIFQKELFCEILSRSPRKSHYKTSDVQQLLFLINADEEPLESLRASLIVEQITK